MSSELPAPAAMDAQVDLEEEEEDVEIIEMESGGGGATNEAQAAAASNGQAAAPTAAASSSSSASAAPAPSSDALIAHLRHLLRPYGPSNFSLATTAEPSLIPVPPPSMYPAGQRSEGGFAGAGGSRNSNSNPYETNPNRKRGAENGMSAEAYLNQVKCVRDLPLMQPVRHTGAVGAYDPARVARSLASGESASALFSALFAPDEFFFDAHTVGHIEAAQSFLKGRNDRERWTAHEYFDPYRTLTHPQPIQQQVRSHLASAVVQSRYDAFAAQGSNPVVLPLLPDLSFSCSHVALAMAELDASHNIFTTPRQRDPEVIAAMQQPHASDTLTFVDLSGQQGFASEYILWRRRSAGLSARGWGYDVSSMVDSSWKQLAAEGFRGAWASTWANATARDQASSSFDVFHPSANPFDESNLDRFTRMIDHQTNGRGVELAVAARWKDSDDLLFQVDLALRTLARGGTLLLQLFDTHTPFTLSVLYLLYRCFEHLALHQPAGTLAYGSGQCYVVCTGYLHDRVAVRPSASPITAALKAFSNRSRDSSGVSIVPPAELRTSPEFVTWIKKYNATAHAYQLSCLLSLLQPTPSQASLLDIAAGTVAADARPPASALIPVPPPHHRIRIAMLEYLGLPVTDPFTKY